MFQRGLRNGGSLRVPSGAQQEFGEAQRRCGVSRVGLQRLAVTGLRFGRTAEHLQHQGAVGQRPGTGRTRGAVEHLAEERQGPGRIAAHRERGGGGGANPGRDPVPAGFQDPLEQIRCRPRVAAAQPRVGQPARRAQGGALKRLRGTGDQRSEDLGGGGRISREQMDARPADVEGRIPRMAGGSRPRHAHRFRRITAVEQQPQQLDPVVPAPFPQRREEQVAAAGAEPASLVAGQQALPLGREAGIRILCKQLPEPEADRGIPR